MRKPIVKTASVMGSRLKPHEGKVNQDAYFVKENELYICAVVSDGAGRNKCASIGAKTFCNNVGNYLIANADFLWDESTDEVRKEIADVIDYTSEKLVIRKGGDVRDYGSTVMFVLIKKGHKEVIVGNLGDGVIGMEYGEEEHWKMRADMPYIRQRHFNILSFPVGHGNATYLTSTCGMEYFLRVEKMSRGEEDCKFRQLFLATDGCYKHCFEENFGMSKYDSLEETLSKVYNGQPEDDATYVVVEW